MNKAEGIVEGLGGAGNVATIEVCANRLRAVVRDPGLVDQGALMDAGAFGVLAAGTRIQVIVGTEADALAAAISGRIG